MTKGAIVRIVGLHGIDVASLIWRVEPSGTSGDGAGVGRLCAEMGEALTAEWKGCSHRCRDVIRAIVSRDRHTNTEEAYLQMNGRRLHLLCCRGTKGG